MTILHLAIQRPLIVTIYTIKAGRTIQRLILAQQPKLAVQLVHIKVLAIPKPTHVQTSLMLTKNNDNDRG